jgi:hypothetical protein
MKTKQQLLKETNNGELIFKMFLGDRLVKKDDYTFKNILNPFYKDKKKGFSIYQNTETKRWNFNTIVAFFIEDKIILLSKDMNMGGKGLYFNDRESYYNMIKSEKFPEECESDGHFCRLNNEFIGKYNPKDYINYIRSETQIETNWDSLSSINLLFNDTVFIRKKEIDEKLKFSVSYMLMKLLQTNLEYNLVYEERYGDFNKYEEPVLKNGNNQIVMTELMSLVENAENLSSIFKLLSLRFPQLFSLSNELH